MRKHRKLLSQSTLKHVPSVMVSVMVEKYHGEAVMARDGEQSGTILPHYYADVRITESRDGFVMTSNRGTRKGCYHAITRPLGRDDVMAPEPDRVICNEKHSDRVKIFGHGRPARSLLESTRLAPTKRRACARFYRGDRWRW